MASVVAPRIPVDGLLRSTRVDFESTGRLAGVLFECQMHFIIVVRNELADEDARHCILKLWLGVFTQYKCKPQSDVEFYAFCSTNPCVIKSALPNGAVGDRDSDQSETKRS